MTDELKLLQPKPFIRPDYDNPLELKHCPLCGSTSVYLQPIDADDDDLRGCIGFRVMCCACTCQIGYKNTAEQAIAAWNRRREDAE